MRTGLPVALAATLAITLAGGVAPSANAEPLPQPLLHYTFDTAEGTVVSDQSGNGHDATLEQAGGSIADGLLTLPGGSRATAAYVSVPTAPLVGRKDLTVSTWMANGSGPANVAAAFIGAPVAAGASHSTGYWLLNPTNLSGYVKSVVTNSVNASAPWNTEVGAGATGTPTVGARTPSGMALYTTVIDGTSGQLRVYVNGQRISQHAISRDISSFGSTLTASIGRSTYNDLNWKGSVDDFAVYDQALDDAGVAGLFSGEALDRAVAQVEVPETATADFALTTDAYGASIAWGSDHPAVAIDGGKAVVTRPAAGSGDAQANLTATFTVGAETRIRLYPVTVPQNLPDDVLAQADLDALEIPGADNVRTNVSLPTQGENGSDISWAVAPGAGAELRAGVSDDSVTLAVDRPEAGAEAAVADLTATVRHGSVSLTRSFRVRIQPLPAGADETEAYVWAFFTGEGAGAERVSLAASKGNDALAWNTLNDGEPVFSSELGTEGLRDPFIIRAPGGDRFFMLATDLKIAGLPGGFGTAQLSGSRYLEVWESDDLVSWSEQRHVKVSSDYAGNTWAPEAYWDEELDTFVVFWASNLYDTPDAADRTAVTYNQMMYATTDDFVTFSEARPWIDVKRGTGRGMIDSTVAKVGETYYRFTKDEASMTIRQERSTDLLATVSGSLPTAAGEADQWTLIKERVASGLPNGEPGKVYSSGEGPSIFPSNDGDVNGFDWFLFIDQPGYHGGPNHYIPFGSSDIADGDSWQPLGAKLRENLPQNSDGGKPRHGTVIPVTRAEYEAVLAAFQPDLAVVSVEAIAVRTEVGVAPSLPRADLLKADGSTETVAVAWEAVDPASYAQPGTFTVAGVAQDASRQPVQATVTVESPTSLQITATSRCVAGKVVLVATVTNPGEATEVLLGSPYGARSAVLGAGRTSSYTFSTRAVTMPAAEITVSAAGREPSTATAAARSCA